MSQSSILNYAIFPPGSVVQTITGNIGGAITPDAANNFDLVGTDPLTFTGNPALNIITATIANASEIQIGAVELATAAETTTGTSVALSVHPAGLNTKLGPQTLNGLLYGQGGAGTNLGALAAATNGQIPIGNTGNPPTLGTITAGPGVTVTNGAGTITVSATGADVLNYSDANATPYVVVATDEFISVDTSAIPITIHLPNAPVVGRVYYIKDRDGFANVRNITITTPGAVALFDGNVFFIMNTSYQAISVLFDGTNYQIF